MTTVWCSRHREKMAWCGKIVFHTFSVLNINKSELLFFFLFFPLDWISCFSCAQGFVPGLFGTSHGALQFMAYEELKRDYNKYRNMHSDTKLASGKGTVFKCFYRCLKKPILTTAVTLCRLIPLQNPFEYITMAALSKIFAVATTYPYQVIRARLQDQHTSYKGVVDVIQKTWRWDDHKISTNL